ncbi:MAG: YitT family protein [Lachnoclostridium sp.]|jgi:uncharacterized membrane-anchored protein YitT (DUF2179 family)
MLKIRRTIKKINQSFTPRRVISIIAGNAILAFGLHNIHEQAHITEGGVLGLILLLNHWFGISPGILSFLLDVLCYALSFKLLGKEFLKISAFSTLSLMFFFFLWEPFPSVFPRLVSHPLLSAVAGGIFVGLGAGLVIRQGGSTGGDDALALSISKLVGCRIFYAYLVTDVTVLLLSLTYIPLTRIGFSIVSVTISSSIIDFLKNLSPPENRVTA